MGSANRAKEVLRQQVVGEIRHPKSTIIAVVRHHAGVALCREVVTSNRAVG